MPYITQARRPHFAEAYTLGLKAQTPGELNYVLTRVVLGYLGSIAACGYADFNEVMGVLESCKLELYRRLLAPYEDAKIEENGDVR